MVGELPDKDIFKEVELQEIKKETGNNYRRLKMHVKKQQRQRRYQRPLDIRKKSTVIEV